MASVHIEGDWYFLLEDELLDPAYSTILRFSAGVVRNARRGEQTGTYIVSDSRLVMRLSDMATDDGNVVTTKITMHRLADEESLFDHGTNSLTGVYETKFAEVSDTVDEAADLAMTMPCSLQRIDDRRHVLAEERHDRAD